jgi:phosphatidate phosphatase APP1
MLIIGCGSNRSAITNNIVLYNAYGNEHRLLIHGRTINKKKESNQEVSETESGYSNAWNTLNFFHHDEIKNKKLFLTINKEKYKTRGDSEGYFDFNLTLLKPLPMGDKEILLQIEKNPHLYHAKATILGSQEMVGIISDIDDTIIISNVTNKTELLLNIFWKNYKQREVIPTMAERFWKILSKNPPATPSRLFFLSGSPQQLSSPIEKFLNHNNFPKHITILKQIHGEKADPLFDQLAYKLEKIEELIALYPNMKWIMFGDSGEKDAQVYQTIKEKYPSHINAYYIRDVKSGKIELFK